MPPHELKLDEAPVLDLSVEPTAEELEELERRYRALTTPARQALGLAPILPRTPPARSTLSRRLIARARSAAARSRRRDRVGGSRSSRGSPTSSGSEPSDVDPRRAGVRTRARRLAPHGGPEASRNAEQEALP
jgi:hypothetical protein